MVDLLRRFFIEPESEDKQIKLESANARKKPLGTSDCGLMDNMDRTDSQVQVYLTVRKLLGDPCCGGKDRQKTTTQQTTYRLVYPYQQILR